MIISQKDINVADSVDDVGMVFFWEGRVFRAINPNHVVNIKRLISSDLFAELIEKNLFPETTVCNDIQFENYQLILEHKKIAFVTLPCEWSFNMLKDISLAYLTIFKICRKHGYTLKDGHPFNLTFFNNCPMYFDLGSIIPGNYKIGLYEFYYSTFIPLKIWSIGDFYLANLILRDDFSHLRFLPSVPLTDHRLLQSIVSFSQTRIPRNLRFLVSYIFKKLFKRSVISESPMTYETLIQKVSGLSKTKTKTSWTNYHNEHFNGKSFESTPRFDRLISIINDLNLNSIIDLAGNKGAFSLLAAEKTNIAEIVCSDYDESAVNELYLFLKSTKISKITPLLLNFIFPIQDFDSRKKKFDIAIALAITHHLLLTQKISINTIFKKIGLYSNRYVLIEFMPLGLWNGIIAPSIPDWYNIDWFRENFKCHFNIIKEEQTEKNRILFLGEHFNY